MWDKVCWVVVNKLGHIRVLGISKYVYMGIILLAKLLIILYTLSYMELTWQLQVQYEHNMYTSSSSSYLPYLCNGISDVIYSVIRTTVGKSKLSFFLCSEAMVTMVE